MAPTHDRTLEPGNIRVLTNHCFLVLRKNNNRHNAFLKYSTHQATRAAKYNSTNLEIHHRKVNVNWAYGFGPKRFFNYDAGESIIPLADLTDDEKRSLTTTTLADSVVDYRRTKWP
ncbi:unnamed protein product [Absidia cylindrospora]